MTYRRPPPGVTYSGSDRPPSPPESPIMPGLPIIPGPDGM